LVIAKQERGCCSGLMMVVMTLKQLNYNDNRLECVRAHLCYNCVGDQHGTQTR
jgi:hypothetical protein